MKINVITQLLVFFILAILVNQMHLPVLLFVAVTLGLGLLSIKNNQFTRSIRRLKWFFLVLIIIFALNTPGEHVLISSSISLTYEGLLAGFTQALRIMVMLAALSLVLACNTRPQLISGFYFLFSPLKYLGLSVERFAARLWLTLHYVETQQTNNKQGFIESLKNMSSAFTSESMHDDVDINLALPEFTLIDYLSIALAALLIGLVAKAYF